MSVVPWIEWWYFISIDLLRRHPELVGTACLKNCVRIIASIAVDFMSWSNPHECLASDQPKTGGRFFPRH
jgi:hypothetical protein